MGREMGMLIRREKLRNRDSQSANRIETCKGKFLKKRHLVRKKKQPKRAQWKERDHLLFFFVVALASLLRVAFSPRIFVLLIKDWIWQLYTMTS